MKILNKHFEILYLVDSGKNWWKNKKFSDKFPDPYIWIFGQHIWSCQYILYMGVNIFKANIWAWADTAGDGFSSYRHRIFFLFHVWINQKIKYRVRIFTKYSRKSCRKFSLKNVSCSLSLLHKWQNLSETCETKGTIFVKKCIKTWEIFGEICFLRIFSRKYMFFRMFSRKQVKVRSTHKIKLFSQKHKKSLEIFTNILIFV